MIKFNVHKFLKELWAFGLKIQASDIYFFPGRNRYLIKIRGINKLINYRQISIAEGRRCINYCEFYGGMNISEHRRPQLGTISLNKHYSLRLSTVGDYRNHESMVIRLIKELSDQNINFLIPQQFKQLTSLSRKRGLILFVGPTGSGKTTSIYQLADQMSDQKMVMTIEDPVEIIKDSFLQLQINLKAGMDYQELLKVGLRHRPDIFIIGEIRDHQTADAAVQASLSGHLVLSTVHAQSPEGAVNRLLQLRINENYLRQCINSVVYQRLLPVSNNQAGALLNIVTNAQLWGPESKFDSSINWRQNLSELVKDQRIKEKIYQQFKFG